jgi:hypothetical protein
LTLLPALAILATVARVVESVGLTRVDGHLAIRVVTDGGPDRVAVHREGEATRVSIDGVALGARFGGGHGFAWTPQGSEAEALARAPARLSGLELLAARDGVSLLVRVPADASVDVRRDRRGLVVVLRPSPATTVPSPVGRSPLIEPLAPEVAASPPTPSPPTAQVAPPAPVEAPMTPAEASPSPVAADPPSAEPLPSPVEAVPAPGEPSRPAIAASPATSVPLPPDATASSAADEPPPVTADVARALFPGGRGEPTPEPEEPSVADLYARLFPEGAPETSAGPAAAASDAALRSDEGGVLVGPFRVRAGASARYVDADTFTGAADTSPTRDRYLEVAPRVEAQTDFGTGHLTASYDPSLRAFATFEKINSSSHVARLALDLPVGEKVNLRARERFVSGVLDTRYADPGGEYFFGLGRFHRHDAEGGASVAVSPRVSLDVSGAVGLVRFKEESSFFDYDTRLVSTGIGYELTPNLQTALIYSYDSVPRPAERPEAESSAHQGRLSLRGDILPLLSGELALGYRDQRSPNAGAGGTRYRGLTWSGSLERRLSPEATLGLFLSRSTPVSAFEQNGFYVATSLQGSIVAPLPLRLLLTGGAGWQWNDYRTDAAGLGAPREDRLLGWYVGLRRPLQRRFYLSGLYRAENRRSNLDAFDTDTDGFYVQLEWNPLGAGLR